MKRTVWSMLAPAAVAIVLLVIIAGRQLQIDWWNAVGILRTWVRHATPLLALAGWLAWWRSRSRPLLWVAIALTGQAAVWAWSLLPAVRTLPRAPLWDHLSAVVNALGGDLAYWGGFTVAAALWAGRLRPWVTSLMAGLAGAATLLFLGGSFLAGPPYPWWLMPLGLLIDFLLLLFWVALAALAFTGFSQTSNRPLAWLGAVAACACLRMALSGLAFLEGLLQMDVGRILTYTDFVFRAASLVAVAGLLWTGARAQTTRQQA